MNDDISMGVETTTEVQDTAVVTETPNTESAANSQSSASTEDVQPEAHTEVKQDAEPTRDRFEKAFAARLRKEQEKLESQYSRHKYIIEKAAADNDMSVEDYMAEIEKSYKEKELSAIDPAIREDVLWARERRAKEAEESKAKAETEAWNTEVKNLLGTFKDIKSANDIPDEVLEIRLKDNVPLEYAYAKYALGKERTKIEQETLKKLRENEKSSVGSMSSSTVDTRVKLSNIADDEFEKIMDEVRRGTRKSLN